MINDEKVERWLQNLRIFAINSEIHCSREEKQIKQECIGTRHVNLAFNDMLKYMHGDFDLPYKNHLDQQLVLEGGRQILLFKIGNNNYYTDISLIHELLTYPTKNYHEMCVDDCLPIKSILNWYEGLVPVIYTDALLNEETDDRNYLIIYDIGKEIFAFTLSDFYQKYEIEPSEYGKTIHINKQSYKFLDLSSYEKELVKLRMNMVV